MVGVAGLWLFAPLELWLLILLTPPTYFLLNTLHALLVCALKWLIVGRFKAGNYAFYGSFHYRWVLMMTLLDSVSDYTTSLHGTVFASLFNRLLGAKVGVITFVCQCKLSNLALS